MEIQLDPSAYPADVTDARIDVRWFTTDDYSLHYIETRVVTTPTSAGGIDIRNPTFHGRISTHPRTLVLLRTCRSVRIISTSCLQCLTG